MVDIRSVSGDIFKSPCVCITNATNSVGIMGGGLAKQFALTYPHTCETYNKHSKRFQQGRAAPELIYPMLFESSVWGMDLTERDYHILMFPTKIEPRYPSKLEYIEIGMPKAVQILNDMNIRSVAFPMLGCGLGGLNWRDVRPIMVKYLEAYKGEFVEFYEA